MGTGVLFSVDVELTWRAHAAGADWEENYARSIEPAGVGLSYQLQMLAAHGLKGCFFVDPMPATVFGIEPIQRIVDRILSAGQEVQLHIHPAWANGDRRSPAGDRRFELNAFSEEEQYALMEQARELLCAAGAPQPQAFRAGSFGADAGTLAAVARAGLRYDSSHDGSLIPWPCATGLPARGVAPFAHGGLVELPIGLLEEGHGGLRHLQIGAVSVAEIRGALLHAEREGNPLVTILGHSFELATRSGKRVNRFVKKRYDLLCLWLAENAGRFPTKRIDELATLPLGLPATPAPQRRMRRIARVATQGVSNLVYERRRRIR